MLNIVNWLESHENHDLVLSTLNTLTFNARRNITLRDGLAKAVMQCKPNDSKIKRRLLCGQHQQLQKCVLALK